MFIPPHCRRHKIQHNTVDVATARQESCRVFFRTIQDDSKEREQTQRTQKNLDRASTPPPPPTLFLPELTHHSQHLNPQHKLPLPLSPQQISRIRKRILLPQLTHKVATRSERIPVLDEVTLEMDMQEAAVEEPACGCFCAGCERGVDDGH